MDHAIATSCSLLCGECPCSRAAAVLLGKQAHHPAHVPGQHVLATDLIHAGKVVHFLHTHTHRHTHAHNTCSGWLTHETVAHEQTQLNSRISFPLTDLMEHYYVCQRFYIKAASCTILI